jgi:hypothetical protein
MRIDAVFGAIGRFAVRFRWLVLVAWVAAAIGSVTQLPALSSVTQSNNIKFLPASAPSEHAAQLATPFGTAGLQPVPVLAARTAAPLSTADLAAIARLQRRLASVSGVTKVLDDGVSPDGHAEQLVVLARRDSCDRVAHPPFFCRDLVSAATLIETRRPASPGDGFCAGGRGLGQKENGRQCA